MTQAGAGRKGMLAKADARLCDFVVRNEDVALVDMPTIMLLGCMSQGTVRSLMREGLFPEAVVSGPRFTRWKLCEVRAALADLGKRG